MLETLDGKNVTKIPHKEDYDRWCSRMNPADYKAIEDELNARIDKDDIHTAGWMPGSDGTGTVFEPLYRDACKMNVTHAGMFFGLIVFKVFMERPERWIFGRYEKDGKDIGSITYFRPTKP